jgi:hypothetical protein
MSELIFREDYDNEPNDDIMSTMLYADQASCWVIQDIYDIDQLWLKVLMCYGCLDADV